MHSMSQPHWFSLSR